MRSPTKDTSERRKAEGHGDRGAEVENDGDEKEIIAESMVDALEDILKWERASERALRVAADASKSDLSSN